MQALQTNHYVVHYKQKDIFLNMDGTHSMEYYVAVKKNERDITSIRCPKWISRDIGK